MTTDEAFKKISTQYSEDEIRQRIDEVIPEYLDDGWEDDFENEYEAYCEQGRGEAESQVLNEITQDFDLSLDDLVILQEKLYDHYDISTH